LKQFYFKLIAKTAANKCLGITCSD